MTGGNYVPPGADKFSPPDEWLVIKAARYLGVKPWELLERSDGEWWVTAALAYEEAEESGRAELDRRNSR